MILHIPSHLEKFEIISQLKKLILSYTATNEEESFSSYYYYKSLDPVKKFLLNNIDSNSLGDSIDYDSFINYYTNKFLSLRGTLKIFDVLQEINKYLGVKIKTDSLGNLSYTYTISELEIEIEEIVTSDISIFISDFLEFFKAVLYFNELKNKIDSINLKYESDIDLLISGNSEYYNEFIIDEEIEYED